MQHQIHTTTEINRYPKIFNYIAANYSNIKNILSFGCSSGEECVTLRGYFKFSNVYGVDSNKIILNEAINKNNDNFIYYSHTIDDIPKVDCIFAMSVFCKHPESFNLKFNNIYNFSSFNEEIKKLDSKLKSNGIFVIYNSNYFFSDTDVYNNYSFIEYDFEKEFVKKFDKNGLESNLKSPIMFLRK